MKKNGSKILIWVLVIIIVVAASYEGYRLINTRLAPALTVPTATPGTGDTTSTEVVQGSSCGQEGSMLVLFIGQDIDSRNPPYGADLVRVLKLNYANNQITYVGFPSNMLVDTPDLTDLSITQDRLGDAYYAAYNAASGDSKAKSAYAADIIAKTLLANFDVHVNNYFILDVNSITRVVDKVGGLEINLPASFTSENGTYFPEGVQTLDGEKATIFVTSNAGEDKLSRLKRQEIFMDAMNKKASSLGLLSDVPDLFDEFSNDFVTDLTVEQLVNIGCLGNKEATEIEYNELTDARFFTTSDELPIAVTGDDTNTPLLIPNKDEIKSYVADLLN